METETTTWSEFPIGGKAIVEQILVSEEINTPGVAHQNFWYVEIYHVQKY